MAIVIDPVRTISAGKVCLGAFRTYPKVKKSLLLNQILQTINFANNLILGLQTSQRRAIRVPNHSSQQNRGLWRSLQAVLLAGGGLLQVLAGSQTAGLAVEQVLGEHVELVQPLDERRLHDWADLRFVGQTRAVGGFLSALRFGLVCPTGSHLRHRRQTSQGNARQLQDHHRGDSRTDGADYQGQAVQPGRSGHCRTGERR